ncbi:MAG: threonine/serine dehydratase [Thaumarchaeota archaeon]|nr:threonine/serine dehydratase [Nitrososphaerota archaeon]
MVDMPTLADIEAAQTRITGVASRTPLVDSPALSKLLGREVYLKLECFQPIKVFKIRGAYNKVSQIKEKSVVAVTSGNHGIATSYACRAFGKECTVILPENPVKEKADAIAEYGATLMPFGKNVEERMAKAQQIVKATGAAFVHPFNDPTVIAGQGTCGLEITEQLSDFDSIIVPVGGAGLISGIAIAAKARKPRVKVFGAEPMGAPKLKAALDAGKLVSVENPHSIADGLIPPALGDLTYEICSKLVDGAFTLSEEEILAGMKMMIKHARVFPEPSGAVGLSALLANRDVERLGKRVVIVVSGGNVSQKLLCQVLAEINS